MKETLKGLGLTSNETEIYITLINEGELAAGKLTSKSGIHRRTVYDSIDRLIEKGLVAYIKKNNIKYYTATSPKQLLEILKRKEEDVKEIIPRLESIYNETKEHKETLFFRGKNGVRKIFEDQIEIGKEILILGASIKAYELLKYYLPHYDKGRKSKKINAKIIFDKLVKKDKLKIPYSEIKYLENGISGATSTNIYGNKVALIIWTENPYAILINDKDVADTYREQFNLFWNLAKD